MYCAKANGRNNCQFFTSEMNARAVERQSVEADLRRALVRGEFLLHYQPIINLESGAITGVEALVRWQHPLRGLLLPGLFMPIAEEIRPRGRDRPVGAARGLRPGTALDKRRPGVPAHRREHIGDGIPRHRVLQPGLRPLRETGLPPERQLDSNSPKRC